MPNFLKDVTRSHTNATGGRHPGNRGRTLFDLLQNAATGQLLQPPETPIPQPLAQGIGGLEDILPSLFGEAFGPNRGVAGLLGPPTGPTPTYGRTPTKAELGLPPPQSAPAGFLPPIGDVQANLPKVRRPPDREREAKLAAKAGKGNKQAGKKLAKSKNDPKYLPGQ